MFCTLTESLFLPLLVGVTYLLEYSSYTIYFLIVNYMFASIWLSVFIARVAFDIALWVF